MYKSDRHIIDIDLKVDAKSNTTTSSYHPDWLPDKARITNDYRKYAQFPCLSFS